jgi:hypothetical protein
LLSLFADLVGPPPAPAGEIERERETRRERERPAEERKKIWEEGRSRSKGSTTGPTGR